MAKKTIKTANKQPVANCDQSSDFEVANCDLKTMRIESLIRFIREKQVILDTDLAMLYGVETKRLKEQVKRNIDRFPDDFMFELTREELNGLRSQIATSNGRGGTRYLPYAFTEGGIAMLSSVLKSGIAVEVNIRIMRAFVAMRQFLATNAQVFQRLTNIEYHQIETDKRIDEVFKRLDANVQPQQGVTKNLLLCD